MLPDRAHLVRLEDGEDLVHILDVRRVDTEVAHVVRDAAVDVLGCLGLVEFTRIRLILFTEMHKRIEPLRLSCQSVNAASGHTHLPKWVPQGVTEPAHGIQTPPSWDQSAW
jgi:hypothetical protein